MKNTNASTYDACNTCAGHCSTNCGNFPCYSGICTISCVGTCTVASCGVNNQCSNSCVDSACHSSCYQAKCDNSCQGKCSGLATTIIFYITSNTIMIS